ncbi:STI1 domain [Trypanosoma melophagium]|uniref:STI1 domain n=1 Tax=Trypanosoma melophagium TaxID=715481 RepID=UPI00351A1723|nr:STI1 domain [Trypanosoma melophagium]
METQKKLVFAFIRQLRRQTSTTPDRVDAIVQLLAEEYGIDPAGTGGAYDTGIDLLEVFEAALQQHASGANAQDEEKFNAFLQLLEKKGYFAGVEAGSEEYASRLEKARQKFEKRRNPYEGLSAEEIKDKGNELMGMAKYNEAIAAYTKAIEIEPTNHIFFANRAAAHTHLKDYRSAIIDCERAIAINPNYSKAYSRLGTSFFYEGNYARAVDAFTKACELEPTNERYKEDLKQAEEKMKLTGSVSAGSPGMGGGFPFGGGMPDFSQISQMMSNPGFIEATTRMMENPQFSQMVANMASQFGGAGANPEEFSQMMRGMASGGLNTDGSVPTPFGNINREALERLQEEEVRRNPKFQSIMEDVRQNGFSAFQKYIGDPDVMELMLKFQNLVLNGNNADSS